MNDKAIEFEATRIKVAKTINKMKETGLNVTKYEEIYTKILNNCTNENKTIPESIINSNTNFATDYLTTNYSKAIKELELLSLELSKYEIYVQVSSFTSYLTTFINKPNKTPEDFEIYRNSLIDILSKLVNSSTLDYDVEGNIIKEIYEITYYFIKEELKYLGYSPVLNALIDNQIHVSYLDHEITKELDTINLKDPKYTQLLTMKKQIDSLGFNANYVNESFLRLLVSYNLEYKNINELINSLINKIKENMTEIEKYNNIQNQKKGKTRNSFIQHDIGQNIGLLIASLSITVGLILGAIKLSKEANTKYYNKNITYSISDGLEESSEYNRNNKNKITITEISPYEKKGKSSYYSRTVKKYDISNVGEIPIEEYLNLDLESLGIKSQNTTERVEELSLEDLYEETIRYVTKSEVDKDNKQIKLDEAVGYGVIFFIALIFILLEFLKEAFFWTSGINESDYISLYGSIKSLLEDFEILKNENISEKERANYVASIKEKSKKLLIENEEMIKNLLQYYEMIKDKKEYKDEVKKIEKTLKLVRKQPDYSHVVLSGIPVPGYDSK